ncbi:SfiI-subtelomeric fragment related protein family member, putative [Theileria annulata]|uniref:SfiI-subtelomeric related protein family member, putative n=1 Tax=Theileria annulata TaxID=5874 RepID=Q4UD69_THEAN|nr:SfiI-subtelomeric fragment related protein family member, putative [Theileria annulata]CAI74970.1 SfiI-subtelomeric fragment related protein family member, putative [Theileria annulata]
MKKCIITINLLFYITFFHQWNCVESNPTTPDGTESSSASTKPTQETTPKGTPSTGTGTKGTPVTLDIKNTQSTNEFDFADQNGVVTYTPKSGHVISKVSQGTTDIWESKDDVNATLVRTKVSKGVKFLVVLLTNNMFTLFHQESGQWKDITSKRHDVTKLKFLGENDRELSKADYKVSIVDLSFTYIFNDGVKCKKVMLDDADVWNHSDDPKFSEIKLFSLGLASNSFFVKNQSNELKKIEKSDLDLKSTQPTSESLHTDQKGVATLTPKEGDGISGVIRTTGEDIDTWTAIWQIQCNFDVQKTISLEDFGKGKQVLTLDTISGKKMLYRPKEGEPWKEVVDQPQNAFETVEALKALKQTPSDVTEIEVSIEDETEEPTATEETKESTPTKETKKATPKKEPKKQLTLVELDLIQNTGSDQFDYVKKNEFSSYEAKSHCLFNKVIRSAPSAFSKKEVVWESVEGSEKHVKMVRLKLSDNHIALLLNNGEFILFHKESEDQDWNNITDQRHNFSGFKFFTFDRNDSEYKELDSSGYTMGFNEFSYGVSFNVECHQIKHNDKLVYNYESDEDFGLLKGVYLGLSTNKFFLTNLEEDNKRLDLDKEVIPPKPKPKPTEETADIVIQELSEQKSKTEITSAELTSLNINDTNNTPEYQFFDNGIYKTFSCKQGFGFNKIMSPKTLGADEVIWESSGNDYAIKVRLKEAPNGKKYVVLLFVSKRYQFFYSGKKNSPFKDITYTKHSFNDIKLFSKNETTNVYEQLDPSSYNLSLYHLSLGYRAIEGQKFHLVKFGNDLLYNYKDDVKFGDLRAAYLDLIENNLYVMNMNDQTKVVKELSRLKAATIDLNKAESTDQFHCTKDGDLVTYTSLGNTLFDKLIRSSRLGSDEIIWRVIDNIYAKKILVDGQGKKGKITNTILHLENGDIKHLNYSDGNWIEVSNKIPIDITKSQSSNVFDYLVDGEFKTFNAKSSFLFNSLVEPDSAGTETTIWKTSNPSEYGNKLVLMDSGNKKYLAMLRVDSKFLLLLKDPSSQNWQDISNTRLNLSDLKMFYFDSDTTGYLLFKDDQYSVSLEKFLYGYEFDGETKCHLIKFRDSVIWNHSDDPKFGSLKSVVLNLLNNKITVSTPDGESNEINIPGIIPPSDIEVESKEEFEEEDSSTTESTETSDGLSEQSESSYDSTPVTLIELDLKNMDSAENYEYIKSNDNHVYTAKSGFKFSKIKKGDHDLKECTSPNYYCKVVANYGQHNKIILYVYKTDKDFDLLLLDDPDPSTRDITSLPSDTVQALQASKVVSEQLKLLALDDDGKSKELDDNKLMIEELTHLINYRFPENTKCSEIKYNEKTVWKYDKSIHGRYYPTNMLLNTNTSFILLESQNHYQYYYTYINDEWRCISGYKTQDLQPLYPDKLRIFTLNQFSTPVMDDTTQFNKSVKGPITSFALNPGSKCVSVKYDDLPVWSYNYNDHEDNYPTLVTVNIDEKTVMVDCSGTYRYLFSYSAGQFRCVFAFKSRLIHPIDPEKIKFLTTDTSGDYVELDNSKYDIEEPDTEYKFKFNDVICKKIMLGDTEVWKDTDDPKFSTIRKFRLGLISNSFYVLNYKNESKNLEFKPTQPKGGQVTKEEAELETQETKPVEAKTAPLASSVSPPKGTPVSVDIEKTQSTGQFDYTDENGVVTYKPKSDHVISKVSQGTTDIWESKDDVNATLVRTKVSKGVKFLVVLLTNNMFTLFHQESGQWKDITSKRHDITKLKFLGENDAELSKTDYTVSIVDNSYEFKFNSDPKCTCIKYNDTEVWKHNSIQHGDKYPTCLLFNNLNRNYLVVESSRSYRNVFQFQNSQFKLLGANEKLNYDHNSTGVFDPDKLKFMTTDPDSSQLVELDYTRYSLEHPSFITYKFKSVKCNEVGYENQLVWKYDENEHSDDFPTTVSINLKKSYVIVDSSHFYRYVYSYYDKKWKELPFGYKTSSIFFDKFKLFTTDPNDQNKLVELDTSQYEIEDTKNVLAIKFNTDVKCTCIMYDKKYVWRYKHTEHEDKYPTTAVFNKKKSIVLVDSGYHYRYLYIYQNKEWKPLPYGYTLKISSSKTQLFDTNKLQVFTMDKNNTLVSIPTNEYDKEDTPTLVGYVFRYSKNCHCVKYDDKDVWEYKQDEHGDNYPRITLNKKTNIMLIESGHYYRYMFQFENEEWKLLPFSYRFNPKTESFDPDKFKLLTLDSDENLVELEQSKYDREDTDNVVTFKIQDDVKCTCIKYDDKDVWKYNRGEHGDKYPTKISLNKNKKFLFVESGYDYRYLYHFENGLWKLLPFGNKLKTTQSYAFDSSKLKLLSTYHSNNPFELDSSNYDMVPNGNILTYTLNPDVNCTEVKYDNISAWNYDNDEHENNYPTTIIFNRNNGFLIVESKGHYESYYSYYDNKWHSVYGYKASKITKNKEFYKLKLYETNDDGLLEPITGFHEEVTGPVITCNIYYGVKCTHVKYDEKTAWAYDYEKHMEHFPTSVVFNITNGTIKVECEDKYVYFSTFINDEWKPFSGFRTQRTNARYEVKLYQKSKSGNYAFINPSKYNVNWDGENDVYEYDLNNLNCALIKHNDNTVWSQTSNEHPKSITYNSDQSKFVLRFDHEYIFCSFEDNEWKKMSRRYGTQSEESEQKSTTPEDSTQPETEEPTEEPTQQTTQSEEPKESTQITTPESDLPAQQTLSFSPPKETPSTVTKPEPTKVSLNIEKKEITYQYDYFKNDDIHTYTPKDNHVFSKVSHGTTDIWESTDDLYGTEVMFIDGIEKYMAILLTNNMFILYKEADKDLTAESLDVKKLKFIGENDNVITNSDYTVTIEDYAYGFNFNDSVNCRKVTYDNAEVWKHTDDTNFSEIKSLQLDLLKNRFFVTNSSDKTKQVGVKVALDIKQSEDTTQYNFKHSTRASYTTLTPKSGHVFNKVSHGPNLVWESKNDIYGTLVRTKLKGNNIYLAILLTNNMFTIFHQEIDSTKYWEILLDDNTFRLFKECGGTWQDLTADRADITKLKFFGEGDVELSKSDYTVSIVVLSYEFKFKEGVTCKKITYSDLDVWKDSDYTDFADIKSFRLGLATNKFFVKNQSDETKDLGTKPTQAKATPETSGES